MDAPNAEVLLDEELGDDYLLAAEVHAKSSACGLIRTNFASKIVRQEALPPPPPAFPSNHGSSSTAMSSSPLVKSRKSLASGIEQTASSTPKKAFPKRPLPAPINPCPLPIQLHRRPRRFPVKTLYPVQSYKYTRLQSGVGVCRWLRRLR
ncbi:hypothetical protein ARMGADRAFT_177413 [Armillaria gallica]|uniref:Uncharacterized protein n=1 Tax=Armillaria gallica TaxID=47427 RepID=A0A2H3DSM5_ARMGA|nr:hypothetical protein ARMGADRAFT_177413 [Armillaria gallica]